MGKNDIKILLWINKLFKKYCSNTYCPEHWCTHSELNIISKKHKFGVNNTNKINKNQLQESVHLS
jgi:hypothetical protein